jgi:hypothetical protein
VLGEPHSDVAGQRIRHEAVRRTQGRVSYDRLHGVLARRRPWSRHIMQACADTA